VSNSILAGPLPQTPWGAYNALPGLLAGFKGATSKGREGVGYGKVEGTAEERECEGTAKDCPCPKS